MPGKSAFSITCSVSFLGGKPPWEPWELDATAPGPTQGTVSQQQHLGVPCSASSNRRLYRCQQNRMIPGIHGWNTLSSWCERVLNTREPIDIHCFSKIPAILLRVFDQFLLCFCYSEMPMYTSPYYRHMPMCVTKPQVTFATLITEMNISSTESKAKYILSTEQV